MLLKLSFVEDCCDSFYVQENDNACDIVYDALLFPPPFEGGTDEVFGGAFCVFLQIKRVNYASDVDIFEELPYAVTGDDDDLVFLCEAVFAHFGLGVAADGVRDRVTE